MDRGLLHPHFPPPRPLPPTLLATASQLLLFLLPIMVPNQNPSFLYFSLPDRCPFNHCSIHHNSPLLQPLISASLNPISQFPVSTYLDMVPVVLSFWGLRNRRKFFCSKFKRQKNGISDIMIVNNGWWSHIFKPYMYSFWFELYCFYFQMINWMEIL